MNILRKYLPTIAGLVIALGWPYLTPMILSRAPLLRDNPYLSHIGPWLFAILLLLLILFWERRPLASIGLRPITFQDVAWALAGFVIGILTFILTNPLVRALHLTTMTGTISQQMAQMPVMVGLFIAFTAAVTEEIFYRGFLIERLTTLTGRLSWGTAIAFIAFTLMHLSFWGLGGLIQVGVWSLVITALYAWRRNLWACMLMHFLNDSFALVLAPLLLARFMR